MYQDKSTIKKRLELALEDPRLLLMLEYFQYYCDEQKTIIRTLAVLTKELKLNRNTVVYLRDRLIELGYVVQISTKNSLRVVETQEFDMCTPTSTQSYSENQNIVLQRVHNRTPIVPKAGHYINIKGPISYISGPEYIVFNYTGPDSLNIINRDSKVLSEYDPVINQDFLCTQPDTPALNGTASIELNEEKRMDTTEKIRHIYQTYNETLQKHTSRRITPIPSAVRLGRGTWGENSLPAKIANWLNEVGDDWQELWDDGIIERMKTNKFLKFGIAGSDNPFTPTLAWLFDYEEAGYIQYGKHMVKKNAAPGFGETVTFKLNRVLEGKYDGQTEIATKEQLLDPGYNENKAKVIGKVYDMDKYD